MGKLIAQVHISLDGFMAGPNDEMDWITFNWTDDLKEYVTALMDPVGHILLGRKLAEGFIPHWLARPEYESASAIDKINQCSKTIFSKTVTESRWGDNVAIASGDLKEEVDNIKNMDGGDIIAYGGCQFLQSLIGSALVDELHLMVNSTSLGTGEPIFKSPSQFQLIRAHAFDCGIAVLHYGPKS